MKLNPDCVRDVLLYLEDNLEYVDRQDVFIEHTEITISTIKEYLHNKKNYEYDESVYAVEKLVEIGYIIPSHINNETNNSKCIGSIIDISWNGHQFLNTIRSKSVWEATKKGASKLGIMSIHALSTIAMKITETIITDQIVIAKITSML